MLYKNRERFNNISVKVGMLFSKLKLSPNQWTLLTIIPAMLCFYFLIRQNFLLASLFFIFAAFLDFVDGSVARVTGRVTKFGGYLDTIMDRYVEMLIILGLLFCDLPIVYFPSYIWLFLLLFGSLMTTYVKAAAKEKDLAEKEIRGGIIERSERLILLFIGIFLATINTIYLMSIIIILSILTNITALQRILIVWKISKKPKLF